MVFETKRYQPKNTLMKFIQLIQLTKKITSVSSKDSYKECEMHSNVNNIKIMIYDKADEVFK